MVLLVRGKSRCSLCGGVLTTSSGSVPSSIEITGFSTPRPSELSHHDAPGPFLHLAPHDGARARIEMFLRALGMGDEVRHVSRESLSVGPLGDVDDGAGLREAWWRAIAKDLSRAPSSEDVDERERWQRLAADPRDVLVWHGLTADDRLFSLRACWWLSSSPTRRVFEATLSPLDVEGPAPLGYKLTALPPELLERVWSRRERVIDVAARAARWEQIRASSGPHFRHLRGDAIVELPIDAYDREILEACREWTTAANVIVDLIFNHDVGDVLIAWRLRVLVARGVIEARGDLIPLGLPRELRARAVTSTV